MVTFMPRVAFWTSRGFNILVPDHRGSTGHGRTYQQALQGRWGELDVDDTIDATRYAQEQGWGSLAGTALMGSSSGGFTALGAVAATSGLFSAAVVLYPVTDLFDMAERSHRFERHYSYGLVGALPDAAERYRRRSPAWHADRLVGTPLLILHGELDAVVPVQQSQILAERVLAAGGDVELHVYPGEGHGFRERANQLDEYDRIERFLAGHLGVASGS
jgi:dipeptidyl aminopeptidase/acylaminoacyl peptidase